MALCAAAWLIVAGAYPCTDILALAQKPSVRQLLQKHKHQITINYPAWQNKKAVYRNKLYKLLYVLYMYLYLYLPVVYTCRKYYKGFCTPIPL